MLLPNSISQRPGRGAQAGFSMVEIALALAVIGFALVAIIGVLPIGMSVQKDNRQDTVVGMDANYLMSAIRSGARAQETLTNHVIAITNYYYFYNDITNLVGSSHTNWYALDRFSLDGTIFNYCCLTNSSNIIGLISRPKYEFNPPEGGPPGTFFRSNFITADFRAMSSPLMDQGVSQSSRDFAFNYRVFPQIIPYNQFEMGWLDYKAPGLSAEEITIRSNFLFSAQNLSSNFNQVRLRFEWPVLPRGDTGNGRQVYRTMASGHLQYYPPFGGPPKNDLSLWFFEPQSYYGVTRPQ